jgi:hypothetical protein
MSGNRFHNKFHKRNHDTDPTAGDIDSATDPMASASSPFNGDFNLSGDLVVVGGNKVTADAVEASTVTADELGVNVISSGSGTVTMSDTLDLDSNDLNGFYLQGCEDVVQTAPADGQVLTYISGEWKNLGVSVPSDSIGYDELKVTVFSDGIKDNGVDKIVADFATTGDMTTPSSEVVVVSPAKLAEVGLVIGNDVARVTSGNTVVTVNNIGITFDLDALGYDKSLDWNDIYEVDIRITYDNYNGRSATFYATRPGSLTATTYDDIFYGYTHGNNGDARQINTYVFSVKVGEGQQFIRLYYSSNHGNVGTMQIKNAAYVKRYGV